MLDAVYNLLSGDATLMGYLTGGIYKGPEISRQGTPAAFDANGELQPCALIKQESATPWGPHGDSGRLFLQVFFYDRYGHEDIESARKRVYVLLHWQKVTPADGSGCYRINHTNDVLDAHEPALDAAMAMSRFMATVQRK